MNDKITIYIASHWLPEHLEDMFMLLDGINVFESLDEAKKWCINQMTSESKFVIKEFTNFCASCSNIYSIEPKSHDFNVIEIFK